MNGKNVIRNKPTISIDSIIKTSNLMRENKTFIQEGLPRNKSFISLKWFRYGDPNIVHSWKEELADVNIIRCKYLSDELIEFIVKNKSKIFLQVEISGMGQTIFEPNIPSVKHVFFQIEKLIRNGFPNKQLLVVIAPVLQNENGLKALKLLLRVFTEFKYLRVRKVRVKLLTYIKIKDVDTGRERLVIQNPNINKRESTRKALHFMKLSDTFFKDYMNLLNSYVAIVDIDKGDEALIGVRELMSLGYTNVNPDGTPVIKYEKGNRSKPLIPIFACSQKRRCSNNCLLCPFPDKN